MEVICLFKHPIKNTYRVFFSPAWAGCHIAEGHLIIDDEDITNYNVPVFSTYEEAEQYATNLVGS